MNAVWAISDPHLSFGVPNKSMSLFGPNWVDCEKKMEEAWRDLVGKEDLVLIPGDISWAMKLEEALPDLEWIDRLPGTKVMIKGNHDYWWASNRKMHQVMPSSLHFIHNNHFDWQDVTIAGTRLWDTKEYRFTDLIEFKENPKAREMGRVEDNEPIFQRELERLKMSLQQMNPRARWRIALTHYPPIGNDLKPSAASKILEDFNVNLCVFGHLHNLKKSEKPLFGEARGVKYVLTSCDYLDFRPIKLL